MSGRRIRLFNSQAASFLYARGDFPQAVIEQLEPRLMLSATELIDAEFVLASSLPVDPSPLTDLVQAAPVVMESEVSSAFELNDTFLLHSNPGASRVLYLDFDGHTTIGTNWNTSYTGGAPIVTPAYSFEGDESFSDNEQARIQYIWQRVAEDYLPFEMDVTTEDPGLDGLRSYGSSDTEYGLRVCIGGSSDDWYGTDAGGLAYVGSFDWQSDTPVFVFSLKLGNGSEKYTAEAISHEAGHSLGLYHDGTSSDEYYGGHGSGDTGWAPIMGTAYYKSLTQFSKGEYPDANNSQPDMAVMANTGGFGFRADDHGGSFVLADSLLVIDGTNVSDEGIIGLASDLDYFAFETGEGAIALSIDPAPRGPNLDILATLYDGSYKVVATRNPTGALDASFSLTLTAGTYYLVIDGTGEGDLATGYSDYGSLGYYSITGTIVDPDSLPWLTINATDAEASEKGSDTGTFTVSRTGSTAEAIDVFLIITGSAENGLDYDAIPNYVTIPAGSYTADVTISPINDSLREGDEAVTLSLDAAEGFFTGTPWYATVTIADDDLVFTMDDFAVSEATVTGAIMTGSFADTLVSDDQYERIEETLLSSGGKQYSTLDHTWTFDVSGGGQVTFFVEAYHSVNSDGDDFLFECSTDGESWTTLLTVTKTADDNTLQQAALPESFSGTVLIRATDTDRTRHHVSRDSLLVDLMFIRSDPSIFGDMNVDGVVDVLDYVTFKRSMGTTGGAAWSDGDFDKDGDVDHSDLTVLLAHFGEVCSLASAELPPAEPASIAPAPAVEPASISPAPVADPVLSQQESAKWFAAMFATTRTTRFDILSSAGNRLGDPPFSRLAPSSSLPWWLRPKRDK